MTDVARRAGVSLGTVSNVFNRPDIVKEATRSRVLQAVEELGFVRNSAARSLVAGVTSTIGFVLIDLSNSFFLDMARGAEEAFQQESMALLLANSDLAAQRQDDYLTLFDEERVAGVLLAPLPGQLEHARRLQERGRPVVLLNDRSGGRAFCSVSSDNEHGGYLAARHLIEQGRRHLAFVGGPDTLTPVHDRFAGARRAVAETNGAVRLEHLPTPEVRVSEGRAIGAALARRDRAGLPDGIVAAADLLALGILQSLHSASDLRIPEDVALVGYDNNRSAWDSITSISTIDQPGRDMGEEAALLLTEEIFQPAGHVHRQLVLEPSLIVRQSSAGAARVG